MCKEIENTSWAYVKYPPIMMSVSLNSINSFKRIHSQPMITLETYR